MRRALCLALLPLALALTTARAGGDKGTLFNGKDLSTFEALPEYWSVKDGAIVGSTPEGLKFNTFLCSKREYGDFELKFQVKMTKSGNSGVQIRSKIANKEKFAVAGPQCDMGGPYWGSL